MYILQIFQVLMLACITQFKIFLRNTDWDIIISYKNLRRRTEVSYGPFFGRRPAKYVYTDMSRLTGLRYPGIHDTPDTFRGCTPDRCSRSLYTGNSDFWIRCTPDISGATSVTSCARKMFQSLNTHRFELAIFGMWGMHRNPEGIAAIFIHGLSTYLIILVYIVCVLFFVLVLAVFLFY